MRTLIEAVYHAVGADDRWSPDMDIHGILTRILDFPRKLQASISSLRVKQLNGAFVDRVELGGDLDDHRRDASGYGELQVAHNAVEIGRQCRFVDLRRHIVVEGPGLVRVVNGK